MKGIIIVLVIISLAAVSGCVEQQVTNTQNMRKTLSKVTLDGTIIDLRFGDGTGLVAKETTSDAAKATYAKLLPKVGQTVIIDYCYDEDLVGMRIIGVR